MSERPASCPRCGAPFLELYKEICPLFICGAMIQWWNDPREYLQGSKDCTINQQANEIERLRGHLNAIIEHWHDGSSPLLEASDSWYGTLGELIVDAESKGADDAG